MNKNKIYIFDLDGVITKTAEVHYRCWKETFEEINKNFQFNRQIYKKYFDGVSREKAIKNFLSENSEINYYEKKISEIKNSKYINEIIKEKKENIIYKDAEKLIKKIIINGNKIALATSSKNSKIILEKINYTHIFDCIIDGNESAKKKLKSKPSPDIFNYCIKKLKNNDDKNEEVIIIEDSIAGVTAALDSKANKVIWIQRVNFDIKTEKEINNKTNKLIIVKTLKDEI